MLIKEQYYLETLAEECCEVGQRIHKAMRFGLEEKQDGQTLTNRQRIIQELNNLLGTILLLNEEIDSSYPLSQFVGSHNDIVAQIHKVEKVKKYYQYSKKLGLVE